jgi:hypothetical protein
MLKQIIATEVITTKQGMSASIHAHIPSRIHPSHPFPTVNSPVGKICHFVSSLYFDFIIVATLFDFVVVIVLVVGCHDDAGSSKGRFTHSIVVSLVGIVFGSVPPTFCTISTLR